LETEAKVSIGECQSPKKKKDEKTRGDEKRQKDKIEKRAERKWKGG